MKKAKIVATIGPASSDPAVVRGLIAAGMNVARLNFSHGDHELHRANLETIRRESDNAGVAVAILADLSGPKIRVGTMESSELFRLQPEPDQRADPVARGACCPPVT